MTRYNIYYKKYNIMARDNVSYIKVVYTDDIYHEVGKLVCTSMEKIESIRYTEPRASEEACEQLWLDRGYTKISDKFWMLNKKLEKNNDKSEGILLGQTSIFE